MAEHCWHQGGFHGFWPCEVCCRCGQKRTVERRKVPPAGHGPHAPAEEDGPIVYRGPATGDCCPPPAGGAG